VLDADIAACFDRIAHAPLLAKLHTVPALRRVIRAWLKAGVLEDGGFLPTLAGLPQGGCISPLLANVALQGMAAAIQAGYQGKDRLHLVRYADDLVVLCRTQEGVEHAQAGLQQGLAEIGVELKPSKTRITHTLQAKKGDLPGFDFLGFNTRQYPVGRYRSGRQRNGHPLGFKTLIRPSREAVRRHHAVLRQMVRGGQGLAQHVRISRLNLTIRGWTHYYRSVAASTVFNDCDDALFPLLLRWAKRRHARKNAQWVGRT
jgi:RNA-directed DNA polymerase